MMNNDKHEDNTGSMALNIIGIWVLGVILSLGAIQFNLFEERVLLQILVGWVVVGMVWVGWYVTTHDSADLIKSPEH